VKAIVLAAFGAVPAAVVGLVSFIHSVQRFSDPCLHWAAEERSGSFSASLAPPSQRQDPCAQRIAFTGQTKPQATLQVLLVAGGLLLGSALGFFGVLYAFPLLTVFGAVILFGESAFILTLAPLTLAGAVLLLLAARKTRLEKRREPPSGPCTLEN
jgi:hypothetical protein